jgi:GH25 family lysozyme M1 (1,4-beta-N-acetylmuramidase)
VQQLIDVSQYQGSIDWGKVATAVRGAFVKVADGDKKDPTYGPGRVSEIRAAGMLWGPYYYARVASPGNGQRNGSQEASLAIKTARAGGWPEPQDLPLVYDFENLNGQPLTKVANHVGEFVRAYRRQMGHLPIFYTYPSIWPAVERALSVKDRALIRRCPLWIAHYGVPQPIVPEPWRSYSVWQDSDRWSCPGVGGKVDHDRAAVHLAKLTIAGQKGTNPVTPVAPTPPPEEAPAPAAPSPAPAGVPNWLPEQFRPLWAAPWGKKARESAEFKKVLLVHGLMSPNFSVDETRCHDPARSPIPKNLVAGAQRHAFNLEILRHRLGDKSLPILSWYRTPAWNVHVGGARASRHMSGDATDFDVALVDSFGAGVFDRTAEKVFANGGFGTYPSGSRHTDSRGSRARWSSF